MRRSAHGTSRRAVTLAAVVVATSLAMFAAPGRASTPPVKTLDDIRIEGEIRLPRVLFITSRDTERPLDFLEQYGVSVPAAVSPGEPLPVIGTVPPVPGDPAAPSATDTAPVSRTAPTASTGDAPTPDPPLVNDAPEEVHP